MKDVKKLKRMSRESLLELLLEHAEENEQLRAELEQVKAELEDKRVRIREAGDLAQAMLAVNNMMETAQETARQYLMNIEAMEAEARENCERMLSEAREEAARIRREGMPEETAE